MRGTIYGGSRHERAHQALQRLGRERGALAAQHALYDGVDGRWIVGGLEMERLDLAERHEGGALRTARPIAAVAQRRPELASLHEGAAGRQDGRARAHLAALARRRAVGPPEAFEPDAAHAGVPRASGAPNRSGLSSSRVTRPAVRASICSARR